MLSNHFSSLLSKEGGLAFCSRLIARIADLGSSNLLVYSLEPFTGRWIAYPAQLVGGLINGTIDLYLHRKIFAEKREQSTGKKTPWTKITFWILKIFFAIFGFGAFVILYEVYEFSYLGTSVSLAITNWILTHYFFERLLSGKEEDLPRVIRIVRRWVIGFKNKPRATARKIMFLLLKRIRID